MRTLKYRKALEEIINFCSVANSGIAIAEMSDVITHNEFLEDLRAQYQFVNYNLADFCSFHLSDIQVHSFHPQQFVIVIDELLNEKTNEIVVNLNYNRDWLLNLNCRIIIIISPAAVSDLIAYSNNFWSCVTIHKSFSIALEPTIMPYLFDDGTHQYETKQEYNNRHRIQKDVLEYSHSALEIITKTFGVQVPYSKNFSLYDWLMEYRETQKNQILLQKQLSLLAMNLYQCGFYSKAQICFAFLLSEFSSTLSDRQIFDAEYMLGNTFYQLKKYEKAVGAYNRAISVTNSNEDFSQSTMPVFWVAKVLNNCGAALYAADVSELNDIALTYFDHATTNLLNEQREGASMWGLFNLSLMSFRIGDLKNAIYYVQNAIEEIPTPESRIGKIVSARFNTLYAYLLLNDGCISQCKQIITSSLNLLRDELIEQHPYILDVHFVFATIFLQANDLAHALHCAEEAETIARRISADPMTKLKVWILLGQVHFYSKNYYKAKKYLVLAAKRARNMMHSDDVTDWINCSIEYCNKRLLEIPGK